MNKRQKTILVLICVTLLFIFVHSMMPPPASAAESERVAQIISQVISPDTPIGNFLIKYVRKIAHFTEYGILGFEVVLAVCAFGLPFWKRRFFALSLLAFPVGFIDESIQILSGRGPAIADVWVDAFGYITYFFVTAAALTALRHRKEK